MTFTRTITLRMPDDSEVEVELSVTANQEKNPFGKPAECDSGSDDGWIVEQVSLP